MKVIATPTSLNIGEHTLSLDEKINLVSGLYVQESRISSWSDHYAEKFAQERGLPSDRISILIPSGNYLFQGKPKMSPEDHKKNEIAPAEIYRSIPPYTKFLLLLSSSTRPVSSQYLKTLFQRVTKLPFSGMEAQLNQFYPNASLRLSPEAKNIPDSVEIGFTDDYQIEIKY